MSGLRRLQCDIQRRRIPQLAYQNYVRRLSEHLLESLMETHGIDPDFPLTDITTLVLVHVLDGVFYRDDVHGPRRVDQVDDRRERGGLTRSRRSCHEDKTLM